MKNFTCDLRVLGCGITVHCEDEASFGLLSECYSAFLHESVSDSIINLRYDIAPSKGKDGWDMQWGGGLTHCHSTSTFLFEFEKNMTLRLQKLRTELFFVHGAAGSPQNWRTFIDSIDRMKRFTSGLMDFIDSI